MAFNTLNRAVLPARNWLFNACPPLYTAATRLEFCVRHLPSLTRRGWSSPLPPLLKRAFLRGIARDEGACNFVETGTFRGDTVWEFRRDFKQIHSIEVEPYLHEQARRRFRALRHVTIHAGDSSVMLAAIVGSLRETTLYWLDGHYSGGISGAGNSFCPVRAELDSIFNLSRAPFVVVIDDARYFGSDQAYPSLDEVRQRVATLSGQRATVSVENDMIIIRTPAAAA